MKKQSKQGARDVSRPPLVPRVPAVDFARVPKTWLADSAAATSVANAVNLLFPAGERFFVRAVRRYSDRLADPALRDRVRGFFGQEGRHAQAHERFFESMRAHGYPVDALLERYERLAYGTIERLAPPILRLSVTVALEHFTAILAEDALEGPSLRFADPALRDLLTWHAVEELEHKDVAFDVLAEVDPRYLVRVAGLALGTVCLAGFWYALARDLAAHDGLTMREVMKELRSLRKKGFEKQSITTGVFLRGIREYLRPDFHPSDRDHSAMIEAALATLAENRVIGARKEAA